MDFEQAFSTSNIQLEPRLREYLNRKTFNRENDIRPDIPEEQEFSITKEDRKIMKRYTSGKKLYSRKRTGKTSHFVETTPCEGDFFKKDEFKNDPRYKRLQKKMASHKRAQAQIRNLEGITEDYTIFHRSNPYDDPLNPNVKRPNRIAKPYDNPDTYDEDEDLLYSQNGDSSSNSLQGIYQRDTNNFMSDDPHATMMDSRDLVLGNSKGEKDRGRYMYNPNNQSKSGSNSRRSESSYNHKPKISYRNYLTPEKINGGLEHNSTVSDIIGNIDEYNHHLDDTYDYIEAEVDQDSHSMRASSRTGTGREQYNRYKAIPYGYGGGLADICVEDSLRGGIRDSRRKTTGFWNPFEHQFDYIDKDISEPNHTVEMYPQSTRGANRTIARPRSSAAKSEQKFKERSNRRYAMEESIGSHESHELRELRELRAQNRGYADPNRDMDDSYRNRYHR
jgi:hypothetical protein